ncbi:hypothetical protein Esti_003325 [Eimeria stiedai]
MRLHTSASRSPQACGQSRQGPSLAASQPAATAAAAARAAASAKAAAVSAADVARSRPFGVSAAAAGGLGRYTEQQQKQQQQQQALILERQQQQQQQQGDLHELHGSELRSLLLQCRWILSFDLGTTKTGLAVAVRRSPLRNVSAAAAAAAVVQQQQQQQRFAAAAEDGLLQATSLIGLFSVAPLKLLQHASSRASLVPLLLQQQQQQQADLLLLGLPLNPCLPLDFRFTTHRVLRHLAVARALQRAAAAAAAAGGGVAAAAPVLLLNESYTTWRALRGRRKKPNDSETARRPSDPAAACELLRDLLAAASGGPTNVLCLRPSHTAGHPLNNMEAFSKTSIGGVS